MESIAQFIIGFLQQYPFFASLVFIMGALRVVFKPLMLVLHEYVLYTPNEADNAALDKVEQSGIYKSFLMVIDFIASIKLPGA